MKTKFFTSLFLIIAAAFMAAAPAAQAASYTCEEPPECADENPFGGHSFFYGPSFSIHKKCGCINWGL